MMYSLFMLLAFVSAWCVNKTLAAGKVSSSTTLPRNQKLFICLVALGVAVVFAKLPFVIFADSQLHNAGALFLSGKTILLGMVGGYVGVECAKWRLGITKKTGDQFAVPAAVGIGVGRLGCFFSGCCYGVETEMPWGVVFQTVDLLPRHPTQVYEMLFHLMMALVLYVLLINGRLQNQLIKLYFISYFVFRFVTETIRPEIQWTFGLSAYQWAIVVLIPTFAVLWLRDQRYMHFYNTHND